MPNKFADKTTVAALMQPFQYGIQLQHSCITWLIRVHLGTWQQSMTTIMQLFQCDLQPELQETHRTMRTGTTTRCRTQRRNTFAHETTAAATAARTFHRRPKSLHTGKHKVLRLPPQNKAHATFMQPLLECILQHHVAN